MLDMEKPMIYKELHFVYIVDGEKFLSKEEAEGYVKKTERGSDNVRYYD